MLRPCPVPWPTGLVVKNGSKIFFFTASSIPGPSSVTGIRTPPVTRSVFSVIPPSDPRACVCDGGPDAAGPPLGLQRDPPQRARVPRAAGPGDRLGRVHHDVEQD